MSKHPPHHLPVNLFLTAFLLAAAALQADPAGDARRILDATGVQGGLVVHFGCGDGALTAELAASDAFLVHGLDANPAHVQTARQLLQQQHRYGTVSIDRWIGPGLPYIDNLVNLFVAEDTATLDKAEILRVLVPHGIAYVKENGEWTRTVKPRPAGIDDWTHYLHSATGNAVSQDTVVAPPRRLQWVGSPKWSRHHDRMASMTALVSANGRLFYIFDEGSTASIQLPAKPTLIARDAFNGVILWKRPIGEWHPHLNPYKSGSAQLPRRLVAVGGRVYVTLGLQAPLSVLDAATGESLLTFPKSRSTQEIIVSEDLVLALVSGEAPEGAEYSIVNRCMHEERNRVAAEHVWDEKPRRVNAYDAKTGKLLWSNVHRVAPLTLAADARGIFFHDGERIVRLDRKDGAIRWHSETVPRKAFIPINFGPTLVLAENVVLFSGGDRKMSGLDIETGATLWTEKHAPSGHHSPEDLLVVNGLVWSGDISAGKASGIFTGRDPRTGEIKAEFPPNVDTYWFHQRCYRSKATVNFLMPSRTGIEYIDFRKEDWSINHWVRGGCIYGVMPANGLTYAPPHSCACYLDAKLNGFNALAPAAADDKDPWANPAPRRLEKGPAFDAPLDATPATSEDWPTYRHDSARSGRSTTAIPAVLDTAWITALGNKLSAPVIANGTVFAASAEDHTLHALDAENGKHRWTYTAGGRIDSPPTYHQGRVLFGSADGYAYCLRASDGALVWRFRAAPIDRRLIAYEQLESVWPIHGNILVQAGTACFVAGRSMFIDGGMRLFRLDPATGRVLSETVLDERDPNTGENLQVHVSGLNMPAALPDILSSDGKHLYMRTQRFSLDGKREHIVPSEVEDQFGDGAHLFASAGFTDDTWFHRAYWTYGKSISSGANGWFQAGRNAVSGRLLVDGGDYVYGFGRKPEYYRWSTPLEYHFFAASKEPVKIPLTEGVRTTSRDGEKCQVPATQLEFEWSWSAKILARAMILAGDTLFAAGPPDLVDTEEVFKKYSDPASQAKLKKQEAAFDKSQGDLLWALSITDGTRRAQYHLDALPVFNGLAAAQGRLYVSTTDGRIICLGG